MDFKIENEIVKCEQKKIHLLPRIGNSYLNLNNYELSEFFL